MECVENFTNFLHIQNSKFCPVSCLFTNLVIGRSEVAVAIAIVKYCSLVNTLHLCTGIDVEDHLHNTYL